MKKFLCTLLAITAFAGLFSGCGKEKAPPASALVSFSLGGNTLPAGFDEARIVQACTDTVGFLNAKDYDALFARFSPELKNAFHIEEIDKDWDVIQRLSGNMQTLEITLVSLRPESEATLGRAFVALSAMATYEKSVLPFRICFDEKYELVGLYY